LGRQAPAGAQLVPEIKTEPDYEAALAVLN
jgi:hypothetical protein